MPAITRKAPLLPLYPVSQERTVESDFQSDLVGCLVRQGWAHNAPACNTTKLPDIADLL